MKTSLLVAFIIVAFTAGVVYTTVVTSTQASPARTELTEREIRGVIAILERELESRAQPENNVAATPTTEPTPTQPVSRIDTFTWQCSPFKVAEDFLIEGTYGSTKDYWYRAIDFRKTYTTAAESTYWQANPGFGATPVPDPGFGLALLFNSNRLWELQVIERLSASYDGGRVIRRVLAGGELPADVTLHVNGEENHYLFTAVGNDFSLTINDTDIPINLSAASMEYLEARQARGELVEGLWGMRGGAIKDKPFTGQILRKCRGGT